jgi:glucose/arabinose dehydrogenase
LARFHLTGNRNIADSEDEEQILLINQPAGNHNGGHILFGPDGYLYIGMGDGGGGGDEFHNAQNPESLHGKILRIAVGATGTYTVPDDNPFVDTENFREEIWALGLRNPWRFNFDRATGDLYVADVGQGTREEINHIPAAQTEDGGMNFGWPRQEGSSCYPPNGPQNCDRTGLIQPIFDYGHNMGDCSVTGGYVYHSELASQPPVYLYADYCSGRFWGLQRDGDAWASKLLHDFNFQITSFGEDEDGTLYLVGYGGTIFRLRDPLNSYYLPGLLKNE